MRRPDHTPRAARDRSDGRLDFRRYRCVRVCGAGVCRCLFSAVRAGSGKFPLSGGGHDNGKRAVDLQTTYFSFVTIATLGYGDITPHLPFSQMLVVCEAMFGQFYVAVVLAWLVSMYASQPKA
jgi:hypothetical protein